MYKTILVTLDGKPTDRTIIDHVKALAHHMHSRVVLMHVADGWAARNVRQLNLRESEEMRLDREYLEMTCATLEADGLEAECVLAAGDPSKEIAEAAAREGCDLIAMSTHGHRFIKDVIYGSVANTVRHISRVPVLLVRGERRATQRPPEV